MHLEVGLFLRMFLFTPVCCRANLSSPPPAPEVVCDCAVKGVRCGTKEDSWGSDVALWEVDGRVQIDYDPSKEQWVMCETCTKWRRVPPGASLDAEAVFACSMLEGWTCQTDEEVWDAPAAGGWQLVRPPLFLNLVRELCF